MKNEKIIVLLVAICIISAIAIRISDTIAKNESSKETLESEQDMRVVDVFQGNFSPSNAIILRNNESSKIAFRIKPIVDALNTIITFYLPADLVQLVDGELTWSGEVRKDEEVWLNISIKATDPMSGYIRARVMGITSDGVVDQSYYLSVSTKEFGLLEGTDKDRIPMRKVEPGRRTISSQEFPAPADPDHIDVFGQYFYVNEIGGYSPMRYAEVYLMDEESGTDVLLDITYSDANGVFFFQNILNDDGLGEDGLDIYAIVWSFSEAVLTVNADNYIYQSYTGTLQNVADGTHDLGGWVPLMYNEAWQSMDAVITEYQWIENEVGWTRPPVKIWWPFGSWPSTNGYWIDLPDKAVAGWDHITVHHEYGHCVMYSAYGDGWPPTSASGPHYVFSEMDGGFALIEGWAEFMQCAVDNDPDNLADWQSGHGGNIETNDWYNCIDTGDMDGDIIEGSVASILWDIFDPFNDDGISMGFDEIWTIIGVDNTWDIHSFWDQWGLHGYGQVIELNIIYGNYGIKKIPYISINVNPNDIGFGPINKGETGTKTVTITTTGNTAAKITATLSDELPIDFYSDNLELDSSTVTGWSISSLAPDTPTPVVLNLTIPLGTAAGVVTANLIFWAEDI